MISRFIISCILLGFTVQVITPKAEYLEMFSVLKGLANFWVVNRTPMALTPLETPVPGTQEDWNLRQADFWPESMLSGRTHSSMIKEMTEEFFQTELCSLEDEVRMCQMMLRARKNGGIGLMGLRQDAVQRHRDRARLLSEGLKPCRVRKGFSKQDLYRRSNIFILSEVDSQDDVQYFTNWISTELFHLKKHLPEFANRLDFLVLEDIQEAAEKIRLPQERHHEIIPQIALLGRSYGLCLVMAYQYPSRISPEIRGACATKVSLAMRDKEDAIAVCNSSALDSSLTELVLNLPIGQAVVKRSGTKAVLANIPRLQLPPVDYGEVEQYMEPIWRELAKDVIPTPPIEETAARVLLRRQGESQQDAGRPSVSRKQNADTLFPNEELVMKAYAGNNALTVDMVADVTGLTAKRVRSVITSLRRKGWLGEEVRVQVRQGRACEFYPLTAKARKQFGEQTGKGGLEHWVVQFHSHCHLASQFPEPCYRVENELQVAGKSTTDIGVLDDGKKLLAVEVGHSSVDQELHNIQKCVQAGFKKVYSVATSRGMRDRIQKAATGVLGDDAGKVEFLTCSAFTRLGKDDLLEVKS